MVKHMTKHFFNANNFIVVFTILFAILFSMLFTPHAKADSLNATVDRQNIEMGDVFTLVIQTDFATRSSPDFSELKQLFEILGQQRSSQISIVNGAYQAHARWDLSLTPKIEGKLTIPAFELSGVKSQPINMSIEPFNLNKTGKGLSFLESEISTNTPYVQQEVIYTLRFFHRGLLVRGNTRPPIFGKAISQPLGSQVTYETKIDGFLYKVFEWKWALYPQQSGEQILEPQAFIGQIRYNGKMVRIENHSQPLQLNIKPIPDSFPKNQIWLPARNIVLAEEWQHDNSPRIGDSITRTMQIQAEGLQASQLPQLNIEPQANFQHYADQPILENKASKKGFISQVTQKIAIVPTQAGNLTLPKHQLIWWNVITDEMVKEELDAYSLTILASLNKANIELNQAVNQAENPIPAIAKTENDTIPIPTKNNWLWQGLVILLAIAMLLSLLAWLKCRKTLAKLTEKPSKQILKVEPNSSSLDKLASIAAEFEKADQDLQQQLAKQFYSQLNSWLQEQDNKAELEKVILLPLEKIKSSLFNQTDLTANDLTDCHKLLVENLHSSKQKDKEDKKNKLDPLYGGS